MEGFVFLLAIIGVGIVILWARRNDKVGLGEETTGLLAMTNEARKAPAKPRRGPLPRQDMDKPTDRGQDYR